MPYATTNPPAYDSKFIHQDYGHWTYISEDLSAEVNTDGYITNGKDLGMKVGHTVTVLSITRDASGAVTVPPVVTQHTVTAVNANGSVNLSDGVETSTGDVD